jgi:hypothetical protein
MSRNVMFSMLQDGAERVIESLSLIDAVMPDIVESRKQAALKNQQQVKQEPPTQNSTNGDDGGAPPPQPNFNEQCRWTVLGCAVLGLSHYYPVCYSRLVITILLGLRKCSNISRLSI